MDHKLKILIHSVSSQIRSGYGKVTKYVSSGLHDAGFNVVVSAYYGIEQGGPIIINNVPHLPCDKTRGAFGKDSCIYHYKTLKMDIALLITDFWAFSWFSDRRNIARPYLYSPMDHVDYPEDILSIARNCDGVISLCKFQYEELKKKGINSVVIPHGVDTGIYKPLDREKCREAFNMPKDAFIIGIVGANADKEDRKAFTQMFRAVEEMLQNNPDIGDVRLFVHANPVDPRGLQLIRLAQRHNLLNITRFSEPLSFTASIPEEQMAMLYNSFDILLHTSRREGFGLCILESMACGTPVIATNFSSMPELVEGHGWLVDILPELIETPIFGYTAIPSYKSIVKALEDAYYHPEKIEKYGKESRKFALDYDWKLIIEKKWIPYMEEVESEIYSTSLKERRL